jgi:hypothetical protein
MPEGLQTPDGKPVDVEAANREFAKAMAAPPADQEAPAPPKRPDAHAPGGETPKRRGRPPKSARARTDAGSPPAASQADQEALKAARTKKVAETVEMAAAGALVAGKTMHNDGLRADAYTLQAVAPQFGEAMAEVAKYDPMIARFCDRSAGGKVTAWLGLATVGLSMGSQLAANHGMVKPGFMNTHAPADIITHYEAAPEPEASADGDAATQE